MAGVQPFTPAARALRADRESARWFTALEQRLSAAAQLAWAQIDTSTTTGDFAGMEIAGQTLQAFTLRLQNVDGVLKHAIGAPVDPLTAGDFHAKINGAAGSLVATPNVNAGTDFNGGGGVLVANPRYFVFDTAAQIDADMLPMVNLASNSSGAAIVANITTHQSNINTETLNRLALSFTDATAGTDVNLTTLLGVGNILDVQFRGNVT